MTEMIDRLNSALEGRYRIEHELGEGGMATVYLAEDLKHDRKVAVKVLRPELAAVVGAERFLAEIKTTAQLQHPHILPLHDSGEADGFLYYVMPYVEGESLRDRLDRERQLPVAEAVEIARKVASALQYAHDEGVVHRDIKPANILIHAAEPVVADFGIALAVSEAGGGRITETGLSLGTPHYMSPEQASGERSLDKRSDVYGLGAVLFEMLVGEPPYAGASAQAVLARILTEPPRRAADVRRTVPPHVDGAVAKSLEKLPADRFESADEFKRALTDEGFRYRPQLQAPAMGTQAREAQKRSPGRTAALSAVIGVLLVAVGWMALRPDASGTREAPVYRYVITDSLRRSSDPTTAISRDGDVVYSGAEGARQYLRLRRAGDPRPVEIPNTADGAWPSFSPDGEWVAFLVGGRQLKKVHLATGTDVTLVAEGQLERLRQPDWAADGTVLFVGREGIYRIDADGGEPERLVESADPEIAHPRLLPDGKILLTEMPAGDPARARVVVLDPETGDATTVADPGGNAFWSPTGHVIHGHPSGTIFAVPFDLERREVTGPPMPVLENVLGVGAISFFSLSDAGSLAYIGRPVADDPSVELSWLDPEGSGTGIPLEPTDHGDARLSPDGRRIAYTRNGHIDVYDTDRRANRRFTFEGDDHHDPIWSPDGRHIAFASDRGGGDDADIYLKAVDGRSPAESVTELEGVQSPQQWLHGGTLLLTSRPRPMMPRDILLARVDSAAEPVPLLSTGWDERDPRVSPDGRLLAYVSSAADQSHVFVREFPEMSGRWQVSAAPAHGPPVWAPGGDALFYHDDAIGAIVRADLGLDGAIEVRSRTQITDHGVGSIRDIHPDGRILIVRNAAADAGNGLGYELIVAGNWFTELRSRLGEVQQ